MKIGILTFHRAFNYGAVLQAYALRETIKRLGYYCEIIDYGSIGEESRFKFNFNGIKPFIASLIIIFFSILNADIRRRRFRNFVRNKLGVSTKRFKSKKDLYKSNNYYDIFIVGSDQVWNYSIINSDWSYLLDFVTKGKIKISYAASFGVDEIPDSLKSYYSELLNTFHKLSVREFTGKRIIRELTGRNSDVVLDPTLLLTKEDWDLIVKNPSIKGKYILCYVIMQDPKGFNKFCKMVQALSGYRIIRIANPVYRVYFNQKIFATAGPLEFIGLIKNASFIVTNSLHGTIFSIIYEKPFYTFLYNNERDIRLKEIISKLGLEDRLIYPNKIKEINKDNLYIDFNNVRNILKEERVKSINFLNSAIKNFYYFK